MTLCHCSSSGSREGWNASERFSVADDTAILCEATSPLRGGDGHLSAKGCAWFLLGDDVVTISSSFTAPHAVL